MYVPYINMHPMQTVGELISRWPSRAALARDAGVTVGTVHQWFNRQAIPAKYHLPVLRSAETHGIELDAQRLAEIHARDNETGSAA